MHWQVHCGTGSIGRWYASLRSVSTLGTALRLCRPCKPTNRNSRCSEASINGIYQLCSHMFCSGLSCYAASGVGEQALDNLQSQSVSDAALDGTSLPLELLLQRRRLSVAFVQLPRARGGLPSLGMASEPGTHGRRLSVCPMLGTPLATPRHGHAQYGHGRGHGCGRGRDWEPAAHRPLLPDCSGCSTTVVAGTVAAGAAADAVSAVAAGDGSGSASGWT